MRQRIDRRMIEGRAIMVITRGRPASPERRQSANAALRASSALTGANVRPEPRRPVLAGLAIQIAAMCRFNRFARELWVP